MKTSGKSNLSEFVKLEYKILCSSDTMGGALINLKSLLQKIQEHPSTRPTIIQISEQIAEEDRLAYETFEKSVNWFHSRIKRLLPAIPWKKDSPEVQHINAILTFNVIPLESKGFLGLLNNELRHIASALVTDAKKHSLFEGWAELDKCSDGTICIEKFIYPKFVENEIAKSQPQLDQWKEQADTSLTTLMRFLKILALYGSFEPLALPAIIEEYTPIKSLEELAQKQYQAHVGYYLSLFKSSNTKDQPLSLSELKRMVDRLLSMLEKESNLNQTDFQGGESKHNIYINQFNCSFLHLHKEHNVNISNIQINKQDVRSRPDETDLSDRDVIRTNEQKINPRTRKCQEDIIALIPEAKKIWLKEFPVCSSPMHMSTQKLASQLLNKLPQSIALHTQGKNRIPRALEAVKRTDPRIFKNGKYLGNKPHWQGFSWVKN